MTARALIMTAAAQASVPLRRYWRISVTKAQYGGSCSFGEIAFRSTFGGADIIAGGTISASSSYDPYVPARGHDGNLATYWYSGAYATVAAPQWWLYDFGAGRAVDVVELTLTCSTTNLNNPTAFSLDWSDDGVVWNVRKYWTTSDDWLSGETRVFSMAASSLHRLWRILINNFQRDAVSLPIQLDALNGHLAEVEFHTAIGGSNIITGSGGTAVSSSFFGTAYLASNAVDGNAGTSWRPDPEYPPPNWWYYAFIGNGFAVVELAITCLSSGFLDAPTSFSLQWSDDALAWTTYKSFTTPATWTAGEKRVFS